MKRPAGGFFLLGLAAGFLPVIPHFFAALTSLPVVALLPILYVAAPSSVQPETS